MTAPTTAIRTDPAYWMHIGRYLWRRQRRVAAGYAVSIAIALEGDPRPLHRMLEAHRRH